MILTAIYQSISIKISSHVRNFFSNAIREIKIKFRSFAIQGDERIYSKHSMISVVSYSYILQTLFKIINYVVIENNNKTTVESKDYTNVEQAGAIAAQRLRRV